MPLPACEHACWPRLIQSHPTTFKTNQAALMFLLKKLQSSHDPMPQRCQTLHAFFMKYERVLAAEIQQLAQVH